MSNNHTKAILDELYEFMGIPYDLKAQNSSLGYLMHGESHTSHGEYYGLFRDSDFDPNHWTKELSGEVNVTNSDVVSHMSKKPISLLQQISHVEKWCSGVIQKLDYPPFNASTTKATSTKKTGSKNPVIGNISPG